MFDQSAYCPYTGLRSFNEDESIYFKGRDQHIEEATKQLEERKFLMLTGSSGDGKSSLVYAGIVPYARAGFLKSHFSNWIVADFKPERTPFQNLCEVLAAKLGIENIPTVEAELRHGYSSLVELYKNSRFYQDKGSQEWVNSTDEEKKNLRRESANLLILADQFEEFFTNPENYFNGVTSRESNLVLNLLLETARIAKEENLPIYVVCTMRSDYIGQCAAFRGLPEFIGYSQFFVPRLNRKQLLEVIEEPALLSGNRISKRLTERLIHDIVEGVDQLPILQHALNQIWRAAEDGTEEMDLIHYAMVGGMSGEDLPEDDKQRFKSWFDNLSPTIQNCYEAPNLQNVLNTHANKLFVRARGIYNENATVPLSEEDTNHIIHNVFVCLTKIDHGRAVRNRMTLQEITDITDIEGLTTDKVRDITAIFRESGNTLIQPFIDEDGNDPLGPGDLMDISHESLIRNWSKLRDWADEEFQHVTTFNDYKHQVDRWIEHNRSSDYLLPIGTLTHFEDWFHSIEPNKYWINRYNQEIEDKEKRLQDSEEILNDSKVYLKASAQNHMVTRTVMRLGPRKIAAALAALSFVIFSSFYIYDEYSKSDDVVLQNVLEEGIDILDDPNTGEFWKTLYSIEMVRANPDNFDRLFADLDPSISKQINLFITTELLGRFGHENHSLIDRSLGFVDSIFNEMYVVNQDDNTPDEFLSDHRNYLNVLNLAMYLQPNDKRAELRTKYLENLKNYVLSQIENNANFKPRAVLLNNAFELLLNQKALSTSDVTKLLNLISPLEGNSDLRLKELYAAQELIKVGDYNSQFTHNGLYQELAYIYASQGMLEKTLQCLDTLLAYDDTYFNNNYHILINNGTNIAYYFLANQDLESFDQFVTAYTERLDIEPIDFLDKMLNRSILSIRHNVYVRNFTIDFLHNTNLELTSTAVRNHIIDAYEKEILKINNSDSKNFRLALLYKHKGLFNAQHQILTSGSYEKDAIDGFYARAFDYFNQVSENYLAESAQRRFWSARPMQSQRRAQFIFPGLLEYQLIWVRRAYSYHYFNTSFISYISDKELVADLYRDQDDLSLISEWTEYVLDLDRFPAFSFFSVEMDFQTIADFLQQFSQIEAFDNDILPALKVLTARNLLDSGYVEKGLAVARTIELENLESRLQGNTRPVIDMKFRNAGKLAYHFLKNDEVENFEKVINAFELPTNRAALVAYAAQFIGMDQDYDQLRSLIKRAWSEDRKKTSGEGMSPERICFALQLLPELEGYEESRAIWKNSQFKGFMNRFLATNLSYTGFAWRSYEDIDNLAPPNNRLPIFVQIARGIRLHKDLEEDNEWKGYDARNPIFWNPLFYWDN